MTATIQAQINMDEILVLLSMPADPKIAICHESIQMVSTCRPRADTVSGNRSTGRAGAGSPFPRWTTIPGCPIQGSLSTIFRGDNGTPSEAIS